MAALDPTGLAQWAVQNTLDRVITYVGEANKYWDYCEELEKYLDKIKPMVREAVQRLDQSLLQVASSSTSIATSRPSANAAADKWLRELEPLVLKAETVLKEALDWVAQSKSVHRSLAITTKKKWADKIRAVTEDIRKVSQYEIPFATHAKILDFEHTIMTTMTTGFSMLLTRGFPNEGLDVLMGQMEIKMLDEVGETLVKLGGQPENVLEMQRAVEASIKKHMKKIKKVVLKEEQMKEDKAQLEAAFRRVESRGQTEHVARPTAVLSGPQQGDHTVIKVASPPASPLVSYSLQDLQVATNDFSSKIGQGGFGTVYSGVLPDGLSVAVKVASGLSDRYKLQFVHELEVMELMDNCRHENILKLHGYCTSKPWWKSYFKRGHQRPSLSTIRADVASAKKLMLVTEFAENGTVNDYLGKDGDAKSLDWGDRFDIIVGAAKGLAYLHHDLDSGLAIVHRDIKPSNIFLDKHKCPKIGDFGACVPISPRSGLPSATHVTTRAWGTAGFLDPEYFRTGNLRSGSDVYSYGITMLCIVSGRQAVDAGSERVLRWATRMVKQGQAILDPRIACEPWQEAGVSRVVHVALLCVQVRSDLRPTMAQVLSMLVGDTEPEPSTLGLQILLRAAREQLPARHIFVTREDVSRDSRVLAKVPIGKVVPLKLHLQCEWRDGEHEVPNQPGRTFFVVDSTFAIQQALVRAAVNVGAVALKAAGEVLPGMSVVGEVALKAGGAVLPGMSVAGEVVGSVAWDRGFPVYDDTIESFSERLGSLQSDPGWEEELRALVEEDLQQCFCHKKVARIALECQLLKGSSL